MAKTTLRIHDRADDTRQGWELTERYGQTVIDQIKDPSGFTCKHDITSIPSPFARLDLVKSAFKYVAKKDNKGNYVNVVGDTIYHKIVSDALDVAQIFFNMGKLQDSFEILRFDLGSELGLMKNSSDQGIQLLGNTYDLYIQRDGAKYNLNTQSVFFLLNYKKGPNPLNIVGSTSSATLFMPSANDLSYINDIYFGTDKPFDSVFCPLHQRDVEFHKFFYAYVKSFPNASNVFPEVFEYLNASYQLSDNERKSSLNPNLDQTNYELVNVSNNAGLPVNILGVDYYQEKGILTTETLNSDFVINSSICTSTQKPLVLPVKTFAYPLQYVKSVWDQNSTAPESDDRPLGERTLPNEGTKYPYLTIGDFLEDNIICLNYPLNSSNFFGAGQTGSGKTYLLPLKKEFFDYFTIDELQQKGMLTIKEQSTSVRVDLIIPIQKGKSIIYQRNYILNGDVHGIKTLNEDFVFAMTPLFRYKNTDKADYRIAFCKGPSDYCKYEVNCYEGASLITDSELVERNEAGNGNRQCLAYCVERQNIDYLQLICDGVSNVVVPIMESYSGADTFNFAVDFGTTNSHVEYSVNGGQSKALDITSADRQFIYLCDFDSALEIPLEQNFLPKELGVKYSFPMRTALSYGKNTDFNKAVYPLAHTNIPFTYEKMCPFDYNALELNLKWSNDPTNQEKVRKYIENICILMRNKVLLNNGNLTATKITWFAPLSMQRTRRNRLGNLWTESYEKYFGGDPMNVVMMTESVAPYEFYKAQYGAANMVTIDIGGGTTDVVFANEGVVKYVTSFRFAANSLMGDGFSQVFSPNTMNGFVKRYASEILQVLSSNGINELCDILSNLVEKGKSEDLSSFLFSLSSNTDVLNAKIERNVSFNDKLNNDDDFRIVFLFFYVAIIYHIAQIVKIKNLGEPRYISFSGNGSKLIKILAGTDKNALEKLTMKVFAKVLGHPYSPDGLDCNYLSKNPKEATCKGGLEACKHNQNQSSIVDDEQKLILLSVKNQKFATDKDLIGALDSYGDAAYEDVCVFIQFFIEMMSDNSFKDFGTERTSLDLAKSLLGKDLKTFIANGKSIVKAGATDGDPIDETLFFYPIIGVIYKLSTAIYEQNNNQQ